MAKKKVKPSGLLPGDLVLCWNIAPNRFYRVTKVEPREGTNDLIHLEYTGRTHSAPSFMLDKTLSLDASNVVKITAENVAFHIRKLSDDISIFLSALEKQQSTEKERRECPLKEHKKKPRSSATK